LFSIIVPAFEEEATIGAVVRSVRGIEGSELLVIDDGSGDDTVERARSAGARVISLPENVGKGGAVDAGVRAASHDVLVFLDADVRGMDEEKVLALVRPVREGAVMCVGVRYALFDRLNDRLPWAPVIAKLSGQRCIQRRLWEAARDHCDGYRLESALNYFASRAGEIAYIYLPGLSHTIKERKRGVLRGAAQRLRMIGHVVGATLRVRLAGGSHPGSMPLRARLRRSRFAPAKVVAKGTWCSHQESNPEPHDP
jgi:glycosyltransferase involved in cell wall biosynthesis